MRTLFMDTHAEEVIYALYVDDQLQDKIEVRDSKERSAICIPTLVSFLDQNHLDIHDIQDIVVVNGPGSFTGERIGVTIAKTLAYTLNIPIRTITSLEMYAVSNNTNSNKLVLMHDLKGAYGAVFTKDNKLVDNYFYLSNADLKSYLEANNIEVVNNIINLEKVFDFSRTKETTISHKVNPIYIKLIGVEENDKII